MAKILSSAWIILLLLSVEASYQQAVADEQPLTNDQKSRIEMGINLIKLGCGTGSTQDKTQVTGTADVSLTLRKLPGATVGGQVGYSAGEAQGLAATLLNVISADATKLSLAQLECMKPYIFRIFEIVFPDQKATIITPTAAPPGPSDANQDVHAVTPVLSLGAVSSKIVLAPREPGEPAPRQESASPSAPIASWEKTARGRWITSGQRVDCSTKYYSWAFDGNYIEFRDQANQVDREQILNVRGSEMTTRTVASKHLDAKGEVLGTEWHYRFNPSGSILVSSSTGKTFSLFRCDS